jgi:hypothetical protein
MSKLLACFGLVSSVMVGVPPAAAEEPPCWYTPRPTKEHPEPEFQQTEGCLAVEDGRIVLAEPHRQRLELDEHGLGWVVVGRQHFYAKEDGRLLPVLTYDNGPDPWAEGLVRSHVDGKVAYSNRDFEVVIPPEYDWGWPFEDGRARVCRDCRLEEPDSDGHRAVTGGTWLYIDRDGKEVDAP